MERMDDRYYHEMEPQKHCPNCKSSEVALVSRIDSSTTYGNVYFKYHCNNCKRDGKEIINSTGEAWIQFVDHGEQPI